MIGLLPAAGNATRINGLPKFLLPVPGGFLLDRHVASQYAAGATQVYVGANPQTAPLLCKYAPDASVYLARHYATMSETVLSAYDDINADGYPFVLFGMPDSYVPDTTYTRLTRALHDGAQVAVAVFPARSGQHRRGGMCRLDGARITEVVDKPQETGLTWIWGALAWKRPFWACIAPEDPHVGYALPRAIADGLIVHAVTFDDPYFDCGTVDEYFNLVRHLDAVPA
jgi:hypothetical protein